MASPGEAVGGGESEAAHAAERNAALPPQRYGHIVTPYPYGLGLAHG